MSTVSSSQIRELHPPFEPYKTGYLTVSPIHKLYYELSGNPNAKQTAVVLHGGPGGGCSEWYRYFFNPTDYRVVMFDQRGAGKSEPHANLEDNTTWHLVEDIEAIRKEVGVDRWVVFGGSWGSTLALSYAETHPERVKALVLRGIFTLRRKELIWFYQEGAHFLFPDAWDKYLEPIPPAERGDLMFAYHRRLTGSDEAVKLAAAKAWTTWEMATSRLYVDPETLARGEDDKFAIAFARIECHYFVNAGFFKEDGQLINNAHILKDIPGTIVQGRYDVVCPALTAWDLKKQWPKADLHIIPDAGHSAKEPGIISELVKACELYKDLE
jgi:proline iminopeptidase